jgi:hypothetical protein
MTNLDHNYGAGNGWLRAMKIENKVPPIELRTIRRLGLDRGDIFSFVIFDAMRTVLSLFVFVALIALCVSEPISTSSPPPVAQSSWSHFTEGVTASFIAILLTELGRSFILSE